MTKINLNDAKSFIFNGGEVSVDVQMVDFGEEYQLTANLRNSDDIMKLLLVTDALRQYENNGIHLYLPYVPYARQDRVCNPGESFSLKVFANLINSQQYKSVTVLDPHSPVVSELIENCIEEYPYKNIQKMLEDVGGFEFNLVIPDKGAIPRAEMIQDYFKEYRFNIVQFDKVRDLKTGNIVKMEKVQDYSYTNTPYVLIDDICDGGRTFIEIAKLLDYENDDLYLFVTHGIFSKGVLELYNFYKDVYTTNSFYDDGYPSFVKTV